MKQHDPREAKRIQLAKKQGKALVRQMASLDKLSADEVAALADALGALMAKHPDVFPKPPVPLELLRAHTQELRVAEEAVRQEEAAAKEAARNVEVARRALEAAIHEVESAAAAQREKP